MLILFITRDRSMYRLVGRNQENERLPRHPITLLLALLMVVLYILEMICGSPSKAKSPTPLPTAVVIQPKEDKKKKEKESEKEVPKDDCRHNTNRHFPSKNIMLQLDVKRPDKEKEEKEKQAKGVPAVVSVPMGAPPPYVETKKVR
ncbi:hypothetical protein Y032_0095g2793 [Ancylostoma ceylanicum]|uniref:Uncharacterized protein n=1 Tax=Ancylostoma ceylanicum TaxID=53326 RepID=A0A016TJL6_9BILA|nr:hypothetical protein Y032_0095g2793 [Ancylostoma ceylanicum]